MNLWNRFEGWVHSWLPGWKTKIMLALGTLGNTAAVMQSFITGLPASKYITTETLAGVSAVLYVLAFWFQNMGERVDQAKAEVAS